MAFLENPMVQYGALGLAFVLVLAFVRGFYMLMAQRQEAHLEILNHHKERERAFAEQFLACIDRNSAALEKVEQSLQRIQVQLARNERRSGEPVYMEFE